MEKVFKHKKTGELAYYKDGVFKRGSCSVEIGVEPSSAIWKEINYVVLSLILEDGTILYYDGEDCIQRTDNLPIEDTASLSHAIKTEKINSVQHLIDDEIFTVGDKIRFKGLYGNSSTRDYDTIRGFALKQNGDLGVTYHNGLVGLDKVEKVGKILFKTEDGVEVTDENQMVWDTSYNNWDFLGKTLAKDMKKVLTYNTSRKAWAEKENAEKYIRENRKEYSLNDLKETVKKLGCLGTTLIEYLENEATKKV